MFIDDRLFCDGFFSKICQKLSLWFLLATSTHKRTPCQRISFFGVFFILFEFSKINSNLNSKCVIVWSEIFPKIIIRYKSIGYFTEPLIVFKNSTPFNEYPCSPFWPFEKTQTKWKNIEKTNPVAWSPFMCTSC